MSKIEWREIEPQQEDWQRQIDIMYSDICNVGSVVYFGEEMGWGYVIDGRVDVLLVKTEEDAKKEMVEIIIDHCDDEINYYKDIRESIDWY